MSTTKNQQATIIPDIAGWTGSTPFPATAKIILTLPHKAEHRGKSVWLPGGTVLTSCGDVVFTNGGEPALGDADALLAVAAVRRAEASVAESATPQRTADGDVSGFAAAHQRLFDGSPSDVELDEMARYLWEIAHLGETWEAPADAASAADKLAYSRSMRFWRPERADLSKLLALMRRSFLRGAEAGRTAARLDNREQQRRASAESEILIVPEVPNPSKPRGPFGLRGREVEALLTRSPLNFMARFRVFAKAAGLRQAKLWRYLNCGLGSKEVRRRVWMVAHHYMLDLMLFVTKMRCLDCGAVEHRGVHTCANGGKGRCEPLWGNIHRDEPGTL